MPTRRPIPKISPAVDVTRTRRTTVTDPTSVVVAEVARLTGVDVVTPHTSVHDLPLTSEITLRLLRSLEKRFDVVIDIMDIFTAETVADLIDLTRASSGPGT